MKLWMDVSRCLTDIRVQRVNISVVVDSTKVVRTYLLPVHAHEHGHRTNTFNLDMNAVEEQRVNEVVTPDRVNQGDLFRLRPHNS